jgi:hypothetical protein
MSTHSKRQRSPGFAIIGQQTVNANWNGSSVVLQVNDNVNMPQTSNGTMIFGYVNQSTQNNAGTLAITSGGSQPTFVNAPALVSQPGIVINNWAANNLSVTNVSPNNNTPIWVAAFGPGVPGQFPVNLPVGTPVPLVTTQAAQGKANPQWMQLVMSCSTATLTIFAFVGGPPDNTGNNGYVVAVNSSQNTGPGTGVPAPQGYYATTTSNSYTYQFNWGSSLVYVVNMSPSTSVGATVLMRNL